MINMEAQDMIQLLISVKARKCQHIYGVAVDADGEITFSRMAGYPSEHSKGGTYMFCEVCPCCGEKL